MKKKKTAVKAKPKTKKKEKPVKSSSPRVLWGKDVISRVNPDKTVGLLRPMEERYLFRLEGHVADFWQLIDGKRRLDEITQLMIKRFSLDAEEFQRFIQDTVKHLLNEKLIRLEK